MSLNVDELIRKLNPVEREKVEDRAAEIIAEEMSLRGSRKVSRITQARQDARHQLGQRFAARKTRRSLNRDITKDS
jgi:hypothetical protein